MLTHWPAFALGLSCAVRNIPAIFLRCGDVGAALRENVHRAIFIAGLFPNSARMARRLRDRDGVELGLKICRERWQ